MTNELHTQRIQEILKKWYKSANLNGTLKYRIDKGIRTLSIRQCEKPPQNGIEKEFFKYAHEIEALCIYQTELTPIWLEMLSHCKKTKKLYFEGVGLVDSTFPNWPDFKSLETVCMNNISITKLPAWIVNQQVKHLDVSNSRISKLPEALLEGLVSLNIQESQIGELPIPKVKLKNLKCLIISNTSVVHIPKEFFSPELDRLLIGERQVDIFPDEIAQLAKLKVLSIAGTKINHLPDQVSFTQTLECLDLSFTGISKLPSWLGATKKLKFLGLSELYLEDFNMSIYSTVFNKEKDITFKNSYPQWSGFPFGPVAKEGIYIPRVNIRDKHVRYLLTNDKDFLDIYSREEEIPNHELQVVFCGETSGENYKLIRDILNIGDDSSIFRDALGLRRTEHINLEDSDGRLLLHQDAKISFWELDDKAVFQTAHHLFLSDNSLYIVMLDARKSDAIHYTALKWAKYIELYAPWSEIMYILTHAKDKSDLHFFRQFKTINNLTMSIHSMGFYDEKDDEEFKEYEEKIDDARRQLAHLIKVAPEYVRPVPISWRKTRHHLHSLLEVSDIITYSQFKDIFNLYEHIEGKYEKIKRHLLEWFDNTGLFFRTKHLEDETPKYFFSPIRVAIGVYNIFEYSYKNHGIVSKNSLWKLMEDKSSLTTRAFNMQDAETIMDILVKANLCMFHKDKYHFPLDQRIPEKREDLILWMDSELLHLSYSHYVVRFDYLSSALFTSIILKVFNDYASKYLSKISDNDQDESFMLSREGAFYAFPITNDDGGGTLFIGGIPNINGEIHIYSSNYQRQKQNGVDVRFEQHIKKYATLALNAIKDTFKDLPGYNIRSKYMEYIYLPSGDQTVIIPLDDIRGYSRASRAEMYIPILTKTEYVKELMREYIP